MTAKVLIFDSGVGGFSVFQHIRQTLPGLESCYLMDNQLFPYGIQPDDVLTERIVSLCDKACQLHNIDMVVIACNTASTLALPALRQQLNIPVIGVVPAIKTAASLSQTKHIALLATPATINRSYLDDLINDHGMSCTVTRIGSSELVKLAEDYWFHGAIEPSALQDILSRDLTVNSDISSSSVSANNIDQMVLGCTHFPLIRDHISKLYPHVNLVDSGEAIARRVCFILQDLGVDLKQLKSETNQHNLLTTAPISNKSAFLSACQRIAPYQSFNII